MISGAGEFIGYNIRLFSGRRADQTGRYWPITIGGYILQMTVVPLLALAGNWQWAAVLIIAERIGKGIRNPPRDAMLSHAAKDIGYGWAFGAHEALDQFGALCGPLLIALVLAIGHYDYKVAFAALAVPAVTAAASPDAADHGCPVCQQMEQNLVSHLFTGQFRLATREEEQERHILVLGPVRPAARAVAVGRTRPGGRVLYRPGSRTYAQD